MAYQPDRPACRLGLCLGKVDHMLGHVFPVVADRVARVVAEFVDGLYRKPAGPQVLKKDAVGAGRKAVGVRKNQGNGMHGPLK